MVMGKRCQELVVVLMILILLMALLGLPFLASDIQPWEAGRAIPAEAPSEDRRVHHEMGFSIVAPPNGTTRHLGGMLHLTPKQVFDGRSRAGIVVSQSSEQPSDLPPAQSVKFLGRPAYLKIDRRPSTFDDPALTTWTYSLQQDGQWFEISYFIAQSHEQIPEMALQYLETLKVTAEP